MPLFNMPHTNGLARSSKTQALNKMATLETALAPKKPATSNQLSALKKATAIKKQKAEESKIRRENEQKTRDYKRKNREMEKEFAKIFDVLDKLDDPDFDDSKYDCIKVKYDWYEVKTEVLQATAEWFEAEHPLISPLCEAGEILIHRKRCELAHAKMKEFRAEMAQLQR